MTLKSAEWAQYSAALGTQYNAFQLGWFPDYPDAENYIVPFYRSDTFTANGYNSPAMEKLIKAGARREVGCRPEPRPALDPGTRCQDASIIPVWQGKMIAVSSRTWRCPGHPRSDRDHAVLEADQVVMRSVGGVALGPPLPLR